MIDLCSKLPDSLIVGGQPYKVYTDYRVWVRVFRKLKEGAALYETAFIFPHIIPQQDWSEPMIEFYASENPTPHGGRTVENVYDFDADSDYIYASFLAAYGIDLVDVDMHWHKFMALFRSLPEWTKMSQIMGHRSYRKSNDKTDEAMSKARQIWSLPEIEKDNPWKTVFPGCDWGQNG